MDEEGSDQGSDDVGYTYSVQGNQLSSLVVIENAKNEFISDVKGCMGMGMGMGSKCSRGGMGQRGMGMGQRGMGMGSIRRHRKCIGGMNVRNLSVALFRT